MPIRLEGMTLYTVKDIEELLGIGNSTVRRYISEGRLRGRKVARRWYIPAENLLQFFNDSEQSPPAELIERLKALDDFLNQKENKPEPVRLIKRGRPPKKNRPEAAPPPEPEPPPAKAKTRKQVTRRSRQPEVVHEAPPEPAYVPPPTTVVVEVRAPEPPPATIVYAQAPEPPQVATVYAPPPPPEPAYTPHPVPVPRPEPEPYIPPPPPPAVLQTSEAAPPQQAEGSEIEQLLEQARRLREEAARLERIYGPEDQ